MTDSPKWSRMFQTSQNPMSSATVAVCPGPYLGWALSETPFLHWQVCLTPDPRPQHCCVCLPCTRQTPIVFPAGYLAPTPPRLPRVQIPPPNSKRMQCEFLRLSLRLQNDLSKRLYRLAVMPNYDLSLKPLRGQRCVCEAWRHTTAIPPQQRQRLLSGWNPE